MQNNLKNKTQTAFETLIATTAWFALILQLVLFKESIYNYFSYFTILSNLLIALSLTIELFFPSTRLAKSLSLTTTKSAIALYILIVGLVYNFVLRGIWEPKGWQLIADNLLHVVIPVIYVIYWIIFTPKNTLNWKNGISWSYFPLLYLAYSLIRGHFVAWYPYPFLNIIEFGYQKVLINSGFVVLAFIIFALAMIGFNKIGSTKK
ncbi:MAG: hypothetical protein EOO87_10655 [Pedobacter sp.]|nr:MAG: hypothetical protein EOO87_10655 [Pedobacter sp.]